MDGEMNVSRLPESFTRRVGAQLNDELPLFLSAMERPPVRGLRMNPFRKGWETPFRDATARVPWEKTGWEIPPESTAGTTAAHEAGAFYLQDPSAMIPAAVMDARPGERILDLCAAPGGKSTQMGIAMQGEGLLVCNEPVPKRAAVLSRNLERMGIGCAVVTCAYPQALAEKWAEGFDGVLVDAPCSGEGMFRRHPETREEWSPEKAAGCAVRQAEILERAAEMIRPGGRLVYATCTWNPEENEHQVQAFLTRHPDFEPEDFSLPGVDGRGGCFTCWPHRVRGEGQFIARMRRRGNGRPRLEQTAAAFSPDREQMRIWENSGIRTEKPNAAFGNRLARIGFLPDLKGIQTLRIGLQIGEIRGRNLIPDHAAALGMIRPSMTETEMTDAEALKYLAGETIAGETRGWTLMTWRGLALGWGKGSDGMIRNHYPKGLRNGRLEV